jgi:DNA-binding PadR family transcriptional regulator
LRDNIKGGALTEVTFFILIALYTPKHGYAIMQFIENKTNKRLTLGAGTLYGALSSLQKKGWIIPYKNNDLRRKTYVITDLGKQTAQNELKRLLELTQIASETIGGINE